MLFYVIFLLSAIAVFSCIYSGELISNTYWCNNIVFLHDVLALSDQHVVVRNAALFALGQFAEHLQV